ncbi:MAG: chemotaxis response regulator protein-glutamate methylesterase [Cytophagales bacterium]|nr:chemotaxis response regulator protein-glutamate methylesterase [Cytophagales bacterium]
MKNKIKILTIDDSHLIRRVLEDIFSSDPDLNFIGAADDPFSAALLLKKNKPDVITLDIEMPKMDGLTFLKKLMSQHPIPVVILSTLTHRASVIGLKALEYGAVKILNKPKFDTNEALKADAEDLIKIVKEAARTKVRKISKIKQKLSFSHKNLLSPLKKQDGKVICIGASAGGTTALKQLLRRLSRNFPAILIVQHMPKEFTNSFAESLDKESDMTVKEAKDGDQLIKGTALIAPGDQHMLLQKHHGGYKVQLKNGPLVSGHKPAVDVLFKSAARHAGRKAVCVILTGMGKDGTEGLIEVKNAGGDTIAQNEESCIVFGMPKEAINSGSVNKICHLDDIPTALM